MPPTDKPSLKIRTARTLKWNVIDRVATQALYAVTTAHPSPIPP